MIHCRSERQKGREAERAGLRTHNREMRAVEGGESTVGGDEGALRLFGNFNQLV